jgi:hypothetical protein
MMQVLASTGVGPSVAGLLSFAAGDAPMAAIASPRMKRNVRKVAIMKSSLRQSKSEWWIDVRLANSVGRPALRLTCRRYELRPCLGDENWLDLTATGSHTQVVTFKWLAGS